jgi:hypothetical protein
VRKKHAALKKIDHWPEIDNKKNELLEFVRTHKNYTEAELLSKPLPEFFSIVDRANAIVEQLNKAAKAK